MPVGFIEYKGKKILYVDYSSCKTREETLVVLEQAAEYFKNAPSKLLSLDNYNEAYASEEFLEQAKILGKSTIGPKREKGAIIGLTGIKKLLLKSYNLFVKDKLTPFNTREEALEYLVSSKP